MLGVGVKNASTFGKASALPKVDKNEIIGRSNV
jgi:hypothetical protein